MVTNCDHLQRLKFSHSLPLVFTEHGALMAANVLNSGRAVAMSVYIIRAFLKLRETLVANQAVLKRLAEIDKTLLQHDTALRDIYGKLRPLLQPPPGPSRRADESVFARTSSDHSQRLSTTGFELAQRFRVAMPLTVCSFPSRPTITVYSRYTTHEHESRTRQCPPRKLIPLSVRRSFQ